MNLQDKLLTEQRELDAKIAKLQAFLEKPVAISGEHIFCLEMQCGAMINYSTILARRIVLFDREATTT